MRDTYFLFRPSVDDEARQAASEEFKRWPELDSARFLKREAYAPKGRRITFADVPDEKQLEECSNVCKLCL